jgi:anti-anti-sigma regulatory factor
MQSGQTPKIVNLSGMLTVDRAAALKEELSAALEGSEIVLISLSLVGEIDLSCLQVIYAARVKAKAKGKSLRFIGSVPTQVAKRLAACGFLRGIPDRTEEFEAALVDF